MSPLTIAIGLILLSYIYLRANTCNICQRNLGLQDRTTNGRIRYRRIGTNLPVCRQCGRNHPGEVE